MSPLRVAIFAALLSALLTRVASAQHCIDVAARVPLHAASVDELPPAGTRVHERADGDLDGDGDDDAVLILESRSGEPETPDEWFSAYRTVVVALNTGAGFDSVSVAPCIVANADTAGAAGGVELRIRRGVIVVADYGGGGRTRFSKTRRFRYDRATRAVLLIGEDEMSFDLNTREEMRRSTNLLTHRREETSRLRAHGPGLRNTRRVVPIPPAPLRRMESLPSEEP